jgi:hypothetical protein
MVIQENHHLLLENHNQGGFFIGLQIITPALNAAVFMAQDLTTIPLKF